MSRSKAQSARAEMRPLADPDPDAVLLDCIGQVAGERALVLGAGGLDVMCTLIRAGASEVTELCRNDRPEPVSADLVVVPDVASVEAATAAIGHARRALAAAGRVVLRCPTDPSGRLAQGLGRVLRLHGFSVLRQRGVGLQTLLTAELPLFGLSGRI